ncbi:MAG: response regulator [Rubrivivax sp.]
MDLASAPPGSDPIRVLVLDDLADNRRLMGELLSGVAVEASFANSGAQALRLAARAHFQLAILDLNLPDMNGFELGQHLHALHPQCALIYCSAHSERSHRDRAFNEGAVDFIEKPFDVGATRQRLATHLERLALRAQVLQQVARLDEMVASMPDAVISTDPQHRVVRWNAAAHGLFGVDADQALGRSLESFLPQAGVLIARLRRGDGPAGAEQARAPGAAAQQTTGVHAGGRVLQLELKVFDWMQQGQTCFTVIARDLSERVRLVEALNVAKLEAERASLAKSRFLANMSHEIRTPMNAVLGITHLALRHATDERGRDYLERIQQSAQHLLGIIDDILDFSKIEAGKLSLEHIDFSLAAVLENFSNLIVDKAAAKGLKLTFEMDPDVPDALVGDPLRLGQILINYGSNAVKFTAQGQIEVRVQVLERGLAHVVLRCAVRDTGIGLSHEHRQRLFQHFHQADPSTSRQYGGTGLGLAIVSRLAGLMGGLAGVDSQVGEGSTFWFSARFGLAAQRRRGPARHGEPVALKHRPDGHPRAAAARVPRVLVVDDNEINLMVAAEMLIQAGLEVRTAPGGLQALERLQAEAFDLVFMDMQMPVVDGLEAAHRIRQGSCQPDVPIVAMTANALPADRERCLQAGMDDVITKPIDPRRLLAVARHWAAPALAGNASEPGVAPPAA